MDSVCSYSKCLADKRTPYMIPYTSFTVISSLLLLLVSTTTTEKVLGVEDDEFDFDGRPGAHHEMKIYLSAGSEECFWQPVVEGAQLYVRFEVIKGEDPIDLHILNSAGEVLERKTGINGFSVLRDAAADTYGMCIDNVYSRFGYKIVALYMVSMVMQEWLQYHQELQNVTKLASNFSSSLNSVEQSIHEMKSSQARSRFNVVRDWYQVKNNLSYVGMWSMAQCVVIIVCACVQVIFVRRLFRMTNTTPTTSKPRA